VRELLWIDDPLDALLQGHAGRHEDREDDEAPATFSALELRIAKAMPRGTAVDASPKLWIRSASRATEPETAKTAT